MPLTALKIRITSPVEPVPFGRGFYQLEEETLYLPVERPSCREHFFSFIESESVLFQADRYGRLIFMEIPVPRRRWTVRKHLISPDKAETADIRFLDFRENLLSPAILCDARRQNILVQFGRGPSTHNYWLAQNLIAQVDDTDYLSGIWVSDIVDDLAGREISSWRKSLFATSVRSTS